MAVTVLDVVPGWVGDTDYRVEAVVTEDFNGEDTLTVFFTGVPVAYGTWSDGYAYWEWDHLEDVFSRFYQVHAHLLFMVGEVSEDDYQEFLMTDMNYTAYDRLLEHSGDGRAWTAFIDVIEQAYEKAKEEGKC